MVVIKICGKAKDVFGALAQIVATYGNITLAELARRVK